MTVYLLDTNTVSHLLRRDPAVTARVLATPMAAVSLSAITEAELLYGLALRPEARRLHVLVGEVLRRLEVRPWDSAAAACYGTMRAALQRRGRSLAGMDLLIAAHAASLGLVLVTADQAFRQVEALAVEDWTG